MCRRNYFWKRPAAPPHQNLQHWRAPWVAGGAQARSRAPVLQTGIVGSGKMKNAEPNQNNISELGRTKVLKKPAPPEAVRKCSGTAPLAKRPKLLDPQDGPSDLLFQLRDFLPDRLRSYWIHKTGIRRWQTLLQIWPPRSPPTSRLLLRKKKWRLSNLATRGTKSLHALRILL